MVSIGKQGREGNDSTQANNNNILLLSGVAGIQVIQVLCMKQKGEKASVKILVPDRFFNSTVMRVNCSHIGNNGFLYSVDVLLLWFGLVMVFNAGGSQNNDHHKYEAL